MANERNATTTSRRDATNRVTRYSSALDMTEAIWEDLWCVSYWRDIEIYFVCRVRFYSHGDLVHVIIRRSDRNFNPSNGEMSPKSEGVWRWRSRWTRTREQKKIILQFMCVAVRIQDRMDSRRTNEVEKVAEKILFFRRREFAFFVFMRTITTTFVYGINQFAALQLQHTGQPGSSCIRSLPNEFLWRCVKIYVGADDDQMTPPQHLFQSIDCTEATHVLFNERINFHLVRH